MPGDSPYFTIENKQTTVELGEQGSAQALFSLRNITNRDLLVHMAVVVEKGQPSWLTIDQPDRVLFPATADEVVVQLSIPDAAVLERTRFALRVGADGQPSVQWAQGRFVELRRRPIEYFKVRAHAPEVVLSESGEGTIAFEVTNVTDQNLHASLEMRVEDGQPSWFELEKQDLVLAAKETRNVDIAMHAPRAAITTKTQCRLAAFKPDPPKNDWALSEWVAVRIAPPKARLTVKNSSDGVKLDTTGKGAITFTVTNESTNEQRAIPDIEVEQGQRSWFNLASQEVVFAPASDQPVAVQLMVPPEVEIKPETKFRLAVEAVATPSAEPFVGPWVAIQRESQQIPWWKQYWWAIVAGILLIFDIVATVSYINKQSPLVIVVISFPIAIVTVLSVGLVQYFRRRKQSASGSKTS